MITKHVIKEHDIIELVMTGQGNAQEIITTITNEIGNVRTGLLWNFENSDNSVLSAADLNTIAKTLKKYESNIKIAAYTSSELEFGMMRMFESYAEIENVTTLQKVFRDRNGAIKWLLQK